MRALCLFAVLLLSACDGKCLQLANKICDCENDFNTQQACRNQVSLDSRNVAPLVTESAEKYCDSKLKTCSCAALRAGDRAACGFQREIVPTQN